MDSTHTVPNKIADCFLTSDWVLGGLGCSSTNRAELILRFADGGLDFSKLVKMNWSMCDNFYKLTEKFREKFLLEYSCVLIGSRTHRQVFKRFLNEDSKVWWDGLPDSFNVYRGCEEGRISGLSWTLDKAIAERFAVGHRGIKVDNPAIASAKIFKKDVFFATNERQEQEIVWNAIAKGIEIDVERIVPV